MHDALMLPDEPTNESLELLDELILKGRLGQKEQEALRFTTVLQISAYAATRPAVEAEDHKLLALLLGRWGFAVTDREELSVEEFQDAYSVTTTSLAGVLRWTPDVVAESLRRLAAASLIGLTPAEDCDENGGYAVDFMPALTQLGPTLAGILYREFLEREGYELRVTAESYLDSIGSEIDEFLEFRPADPRVRMLRSDYHAFQARTSVANLMSQWLDKPKAIYAWLTDLAAIEERLAILGGTLSTGLGHELAGRSTKKVLILGRHLEPPASANAA